MDNNQALTASIEALLAELDRLAPRTADTELRQLCRNASEGLRALAQRLEAQPAEHAVLTASPSANR